MTSINGIPYPTAVKDRVSFLAWFESIDRPRSTSDGPAATIMSGPHRELYESAIFPTVGPEYLAIAEETVCRSLAAALFYHLILAPKADLVIRIAPEFDIGYLDIPSDLSKTFSRKQLDEMFHLGDPRRPVPIEDFIPLLPKDQLWSPKFTTDSIIAVSSPFKDWAVFKSYVRYSLILDGRTIEWPRTRS